jgi:hypothetical protein
MVGRLTMSCCQFCFGSYDPVESTFIEAEIAVQQISLELVIRGEGDRKRGREESGYMK